MIHLRQLRTVFSLTATLFHSGNFLGARTVIGVFVISGRRRFLVPERIPSHFPRMNMCRPLPHASVSFTLHLVKTVRRRASTLSKLFTTSEYIVYASLPLIPVEAPRGSCSDNSLFHIFCCRLLPNTIPHFNHLPIVINCTDF